MGFVKLDRKLLEWEWFTDHNTLTLWIYLLLNASWEDNRFKGIDVPRGSLITGRKKISIETGLTEQQVRTAINHLKSTNEITINSTKEYTLITVNKWGDYQDCTEKPTKKSTNKSTDNQPTSNQQVTTTKEYKKIKEYKNTKNIYIPPTSNEFELGVRYLLPLISNKEQQMYRYREITKDDIDNWQSIYSSADVENEIRKMCAWADANPTKRKTPSGANRFINAWLSKAHDRAIKMPKEEGGLAF